MLSKIAWKLHLNQTLNLVDYYDRQMAKTKFKILFTAMLGYCAYRLNLYCTLVVLVKVIYVNSDFKQ